ncbi:MAG: type VI secretion system-associated protein TagF [Limnobacter sp.]|nr:type VI secretion system-associated protein TagF [Limnobacter sp.]
MSTPQFDQFCWFGKLPAHGDFLQGNLSELQKATLDTMLSKLMADTQANPVWLSRYFETSPFDLLGHCPSLGPFQAFLMPSIDKVGRAFPWMVIKPTAGAFCPFLQKQVEQLSVAAFDEDWNINTLISKLSQLIKDKAPANMSIAPESQCAAPVASALPLHTMMWRSRQQGNEWSSLTRFPPCSEQWGEMLHERG